MQSTRPTAPPPDDWWDQAFAPVPYEKSPPAQDQMLILIAYDIAAPQRLAKIAKTCADFGVRVQYSLFECHLTTAEFDTLWRRLLDLIHAGEDRLVAYRLDARNARETLTAGAMARSEKISCHLI